MYIDPDLQTLPKIQKIKIHTQVEKRSLMSRENQWTHEQINNTTKQPKQT